MSTFRTRARAVDMLGRQQIAGVPTAMSELFKNAHDAYATKAEVDYYGYQNLIVIRDNGFGMSRLDLENRWLVLGTDSKASLASGLDPLPIPSDPKLLRPIMGEKGIGRLAIAIVGGQALLLSRAQRKGKDEPLVAAFLNWGIFSLPGVNLEEITIPIREFVPGDLPSSNDIREMVEEVEMGLDVIESRLIGAIDKQLAESSENEELRGERDSLKVVIAGLREELAGFTFDPARIDKHVNDLSLAEGYGTHFYISPVNPTVNTDLLAFDRGNVSELVQLLVGFTNEMTPNSDRPRIQISFRHHQAPGQWRDILREAGFFTTDDFDGADQRIIGSFDETGTFRGDVSVYREDYVPYEVPWKPMNGRRTACGPFRIAFAYIQGNAWESKIPIQEWRKLDERLQVFGGIYVFRDGIRILPYGLTNFDWLDVEKRRNLGAGHYFFSYRRLFGGVLISRAENNALAEKAGREGFQQNNAYRELRAILMEFFVRLASDFFRKDGDNADVFLRVKEEFNRIHKARLKREREAKKTRKGFEGRLTKWFDRIAEGEPQKQAEKLIRETRERVEHALKSGDPAREVLEQEALARRSLQRIETGFEISRPRGFGLSRRLENVYASYSSARDRLRKDVFEPAESSIREIITELSMMRGIELDRRQRIYSVLKETASSLEKRIKSESEGMQAKFLETVGHIRTEFKRCEERYDESVQSISDEFHNADDSDLDDGYEDGLVKQIRHAFEVEYDKVQQLHSQIAFMDSYFKEREDAVSIVETTEALEQEVLELRRRVDFDLERTQIGIAVEIISHEFSKWLRALTRSVEDLEPFTKASKSFQEPYQRLRDAMDHVSSYLALLLPLMPVNNLPPTDVKGSELAQFVESVFSESLAAARITLDPTPAFLAAKTHTYTSVLYSVFVNLLDNAIYWVSDQTEDKKRLIRLDWQSEVLYVSDSGPGIPPSEQDEIFEHGVSSKPGGRGIGLHVARESLRKTGFDLTLTEHGNLGGATFAISKRQPSEDVDEL